MTDPRMGKDFAKIPSIDVDCPICQAPPGEPCRAPRGHVSRLTHHIRQKRVDRFSLEYMRYVFDDEESEVYAMECPQCGRNTVAKHKDYLCVTCRDEEKPNERYSDAHQCD